MCPFRSRTPQPRLSVTILPISNALIPLDLHSKDFPKALPQQADNPRPMNTLEKVREIQRNVAENGEKLKHEELCLKKANVSSARRNPQRSKCEGGTNPFCQVVFTPLSHLFDFSARNHQPCSGLQIDRSSLRIGTPLQQDALPKTLPPGLMSDLISTAIIQTFSPFLFFSYSLFLFAFIFVLHPTRATLLVVKQ